MTVWLGHHARALAATLAALARAPLTSLLNIAVIGVALALPAGMYLALDNLRTAAGHVDAEPRLTVFLALDAPRTEAQAMGGRLRAHAGVRDATFLPREQALADLRQRAGLADVIDSLPGNPLPDAWVVAARDPSPAALDALRAEIARWPKVAHVQLDAQWARRLEAALHLGRFVVLLLAGLLGTALVAVTFNTIRLQILTRREEIEVSRLIGATRSFIRRPFLYAGAVQGAAGGAAAWLVLSGAVMLLNRALAEIGETYGLPLRLTPLSGQDGASLLAFAGLLGWVGAWASVSSHLLDIDSD
jgi:cell division transport system permease protein